MNQRLVDLVAELETLVHAQIETEECKKGLSDMLVAHQYIAPDNVLTTTELLNMLAVYLDDYEALKREVDDLKTEIRVLDERIEELS